MDYSEKSKLINPYGGCDLEELNNIEASFPAFVLGDKRLRSRQLFCKAHLRKPCFFPRVDEKPAKPIILLAKDRFCHRDSTPTRLAFCRDSKPVLGLTQNGFLFAIPGT